MSFLFSFSSLLLVFVYNDHALYNIIIYRLDAETKGSTRFRIPTALSCSVPSAARTLLRAGGILNRVDPIGRGV